MIAMVRRSRIFAEDLAAELRAAGKNAARKRPRGSDPHEAVSELETAMISEALAAHDNNQLRAAEALGLSRQGLINKITRYGIGIRRAMNISSRGSANSLTNRDSLNFIKVRNL